MRRVARHGLAAGIYAAAVVAALVLVNAIGSQIHKRWDLTANHRFTLSEASRRILAELQQPVHIYAFLQPGSQTAGQIRDLLQEYADAGRGRVTYEVIDPGAHPTEARRFNVTEYDTVVVQAGSDTESVTPADLYSYGPRGANFAGEQAVTNAILRAANPQHPPVYFLTGHGEHAIDGDYSQAFDALRSQGYRVESLNLVEKGEVPKDAAAVAVAGPRRDLAAAEADALRRYAQAGGHLLVLLDPRAGPPLENLDRLLQDWGVQVDADVVVDPARHFQLDPTNIVPRYDTGPVTDPLAGSNLATVFPAAVSLHPLKAAGYQVAPLLQTSESAWGKTDLKDPNLTRTARDLGGPLDLALSVTAQNGFKAVVFGSSTFALDRVVQIQGNRDLFLNSVGWLTGRAQGITIRPEAGLENQVFLSNSVIRGLLYTLLVFLPLASLGGAGAIWSWRRAL